MNTADNPQYLYIKAALDEYRNHPMLATAPKLAEAVNPLLYELAAAHGEDCSILKDSATEIGKCLLATAVKAVNETRHSFTPHGLQKFMITLKNADEVMTYISQLPLNAEFRNSILDPQRTRLRGLINAVETLSENRKPQLITWQTGKISAPEAYTQNKHTNRKASFQMYIAIVVALGLAIYIFEIVKQRTEFHKIADNYTEEAVTAYLSDHGNTHYRDDALELYLSQMDSILLNPLRLSQPSQFPPLTRMDNLARSGLLPEYVRVAVAERVKLRTDSLYAIAKERDDLKGWYFFQAQAPSTLYYDSSERIDSLEEAAWSSEPTAWEAARSSDTRDAYKRYLVEFPGGAHSRQADGRLVDMEVNDFRNRGKSTENRIERVGDNATGGSIINIFNDSDSDMELLFSGPDSKRLSVPSKDVGSINIADGEYKILLKASGYRNAKFTFYQTFDRGHYSSVFSIGSDRQDR